MSFDLMNSKGTLGKVFLASTFILLAACGSEKGHSVGVGGQVGNAEKPAPEDSPAPTPAPTATPSVPSPTPKPDVALGEPKFCDPNTFSKYEQKIVIDGIDRLHVYKLGKLTLSGMAVGHSDANAIVNMASEFADVPKSEKSCTWYFNEGSADAETFFNHKYVPNPGFWQSRTKMVEEYSKALNTTFDSDPINMVSCAAEHNYVAMGCNGQKHRGPTVFAMFLAYAGCSPENAVKIAKNIWGSNHVSSDTREAIAKKASEWGSQRREARRKLLEVMLAE